MIGAYRNSRLPDALLPPDGYIQLRQEWISVTIYSDIKIPKGNVIPPVVGGITSGDSCGEKGEWREYVEVKFLPEVGFHYLRVCLTEEEIALNKRRDRCDRCGHLRYGWCVFEDIDAPVPSGKLSRRARFAVDVKAVILISLFDGIAGARVALEALSVNSFNVATSLSSEIDDEAIKVTKRSFVDTIELGNVEKVTRLTIEKTVFANKNVARLRQHSPWGDELHFILVAGSPCQDLSRAKAVKGKTEGVVKGQRSSLFYHIPRILKYLTQTLGGKHNIVHFIVENVEMSLENQEIFTTFLNGVKPCRIDCNRGGSCASLMSRPRLYWCSFLPRGQDFGLSDLKNENCVHEAKSQNLPLEHVLAKHGFSNFEFFDKRTGKSCKSLPTLTRFAGNVGQEKYWIRRKDIDAMTLNVESQRSPQNVNEDLLGFPIGHTAGQGRSEKDRQKLLGNTFMVYHIRFLLKRLHLRILRGMPYGEFSAKIMMSPQQRCSEMVRAGKNASTYREISQLLRDKGFDDLDKSTTGTMFEHIRN